VLVSATTMRFIRKESKRHLKRISSVWKRKVLGIANIMPKYAQAVKWASDSSLSYGNQILAIYFSYMSSTHCRVTMISQSYACCLGHWLLV